MQANTTPLRVDVAIVGAGPSGLSTALALARVLPPDVSIAVFEGRCPGEAGSGIDFSENGLRALEAISPRLLHKFYEAGDFQNNWAHYDDVSGALVSCFGLPQAGAERKAARLLPPLKMRWWAITRVLEEELPAGVGLYYGHKLLDCSECAAAAAAEDAATAAAEDAATAAANTAAANAAATAEAQAAALKAAADSGNVCGARSRSGGNSGGSGDGRDAYRYRLTFLRTDSGAGSDGGGSSVTTGSSNGGDASQATTTVFAKWLIGADGSFSRVRRSVGDGRAPTFTGRFSWWGRVSGEELTAAAAAAGVADVEEFWPAPLRGPPGSPMVRNAIYMPAADRASTTRAVMALLVRLRAPSLMQQQAQQQGAAAAEATGGGSGAGSASGRADDEAQEERHERDGREKPEPVLEPEPGQLQEVVGWYVEALTDHLQAAGLDATPEGPHLRHSAPDGGHEVALARCLAVAAHLPADVRACLAATPPARVLERALHMHSPDQHELSSWTNGRGVVLVGDAVHSMGRPDGQGGSLAIEDGAELAAHVRQHGLGQQAFDAFAASRLPRVKGIRGDNVPPFALRRALIDATAFEPLWGPGDLPSPEELLRAELDGRRVCAAGAQHAPQESSAVVPGQGQKQAEEQAEEPGVVEVVARVGVAPPGEGAAAAGAKQGLGAAGALDSEAVREWSWRRCWEIAERRTRGQVLVKG